MKITQCDKCKKKIKKDAKSISIHFYSGLKDFSWPASLDLCEQCSRQLNFLVKKFLSIKN